MGPNLALQKLDLGPYVTRTKFAMTVINHNAVHLINKAIYHDDKIVHVVECGSYIC